MNLVKKWSSITESMTTETSYIKQNEERITGLVKSYVGNVF
jgi:hypothetical protein